MKKIYPITILMAAGLNAATVIDFGSTDYVTADANFVERATNPSSGIDRNAFDTNTLAPNTNTGTASLPSFIGGYELLSTGANNYNFTREQIRNDWQSSDPIFLQAFRDDAADGDAEGSTTLSFHAVFLFPTAQAFSISDVSVRTGNASVNNSNFTSIRLDTLAVESGGQIYVNKHHSFYNADTTLTRGTTLVDEWVSYDPTTNLDADLSNATIVLGSALDSITAIGVYSEAESFSNSGLRGSHAGFEIRSFEVNAVPEPSSYALIAGSLTLALIGTRRRK